MRTTPVGSDDRAVSDVVGYVLIFSLITVSVGVITVGGFSTLEDRQDAERINNAERAFDVLAANVEDVYRGGAPSRATEMQLSGGTLRYGEQTNITIDSDDVGPIQVTPLVYTDGDTEIVYSAGAVFRSSGDSSVMLRDPPFYKTSNRLVLPVIRTYSTTGRQSISTDRTVRITGEARAVNTTALNNDGYTVTIRSSRSDAWEQYFNSQSGIDSVKRNGKTVEAQTDQKVQLSEFPIRIHVSK